VQELPGVFFQDTCFILLHGFDVLYMYDRIK